MAIPTRMAIGMERLGPLVLRAAARRSKTTATTVRGGVKLAEVSGPTDVPLRHETIGQAFATTVRVLEGGAGRPSKISGLSSYAPPLLYTLHLSNPP